MLLPGELKVKFGDEYGSIYYTATLVLLQNDNVKKMSQNDKCNKSNVL